MQEAVYIPNKKRLRLATIIHKPKKSDKSPAVVLLHGFTGYKDETHIVSLANKLSESGYVAIRFDASGFGESDGTLKNDYRMTNYYQDINCIFDYVKSLDYVDKTSLGIWGNSLGGTLAVIFASKNPWLKAVCVISSPTTFARKDNFSRRTKEWERVGYFQKDSSLYGHLSIPYDFVIDSEKWDASKLVEHIDQPSLFILGSSDTNVDPVNTKKLFELARGPKKLIEISGMDHFYKNNSNYLTQVNNHVIDFYNSVLLFIPR